MQKTERQDRILEFLSTAKKVNFTDLSQMLDVSYDSVRRDVIELEDKGLLRKVHGGVVSNSYLNILSGQRNGVLNSDDLQIILKKSLKLLRNNQTIILDGGTTNFFFAEQIPKNLHLTVITNSMPLAMALNEHENIEVIVLGGKYYKRYQITHGLEAMRHINRFNADLYFMGVNGVDSKKGLTLRHYEESNLKQAMMKVSKKIYSGVITEKIGVVEAYQVCECREVDGLITNLNPKDKLLLPFTDVELL
jgi:DeoR/GlpR family transcriptional regulator of sugar metabolism